jgi:hypothetical protein
MMLGDDGPPSIVTCDTVSDSITVERTLIEEGYAVLLPGYQQAAGRVLDQVMSCRATQAPACYPGPMPSSLVRVKWKNASREVGL